jgi:hypothetical protein
MLSVNLKYCVHVCLLNPSEAKARCPKLEFDALLMLQIPKLDDTRVISKFLN